MKSKIFFILFYSFLSFIYVDAAPYSGGFRGGGGFRPSTPSFKPSIPAPRPAPFPRTVPSPLPKSVPDRKLPVRSGQVGGTNHFNHTNHYSSNSSFPWWWWLVMTNSNSHGSVSGDAKDTLNQNQNKTEAKAKSKISPWKITGLIVTVGSVIFGLVWGIKKWFGF